jgi:hypothetical protein
MGKRSDFERVPRDFYPTPREAVFPLLPHLRPESVFAEPCAGSGDLIRWLEAGGHTCAIALDTDPKCGSVDRGDALSTLFVNIHYIITNPPWTRSILHPMITHFAHQGPTWLLFDADWPHTKQAVPYLPLLRKIVAVGRLKWIPGSTSVGKDNCCWYLFDAKNNSPTEFVGRTLTAPKSRTK